MQNVIKIVVLLLMSGIAIHAQENKLTTSVALVGMSMDYREYSRNTGTLLNSEESDFTDLGGADLGISFLVTKTSLSSTTLEANVLFLSGTTVYKGSILGSGNPYGSYVGTTTNKVTDYRLLLRQNHSLDNSFDFHYAFGFGHRSWERVLSAAQLEVYEWYSCRVLLGADYQITRKFKIGTEIEYQYGFEETMSESSLGLTFDLGGADILKIAIPVVYNYTNAMDIVFKAIYEKQTIVESNLINGYYEPRSTAKNQYLQIGLDFKF